MTKHDKIKELVKVIRSELNYNGIDGTGRVSNYNDLSVEIKCYLHKDLQDKVLDILSKYKEFIVIDDEYAWRFSDKPLDYCFITVI